MSSDNIRSASTVTTLIAIQTKCEATGRNLT
jgi:hypothetical protein